MAGVQGYVLAGGKSRRMGQDKALMPVNGQPMVLRAADVLRPFVDEVSLLAPAGRYEHLGLPVVPDKWAEGPLAGICAGLFYTHARWNIFLACDLPLVSKTFVQLLTQRIHATQCDAVVPRTTDGWQPLSAAYRANCQTAFTQALQQGERSIVRLLGDIRVEEITTDQMQSAGVREAELANVNTPEDWARVTSITNVPR
jgi:molybdenum cofactor guanylyltransferase